MEELDVLAAEVGVEVGVGERDQQGIGFWRGFHEIVSAGDFVQVYANFVGLKVGNGVIRSGLSCGRVRVLGSAGS